MKDYISLIGFIYSIISFALYIEWLDDFKNPIRNFSVFILIHKLVITIGSKLIK